MRFPDWQQKFEAALLEGDLQKLPQLMKAAEAAIFLRLQSLSNGSDGHVERDALTDAMLTLRAIQTEKMPSLGVGDVPLRAHLRKPP
jgi:hypothetical protein